MKKIRVIFENEAKSEFEKLIKTVADETNRGIKKSKNQTLLSTIYKKIELLKTNPQAGRVVKKSLIPKIYSYHLEKLNIQLVSSQLH